MERYSKFQVDICSDTEVIHDKTEVGRIRPPHGRGLKYTRHQYIPEHLQIVPGPDTYQLHVSRFRADPAKFVMI